MNILFEIGHPAHVHLFKYIIRNLEKTHDIKICVRERENIVGNLLDFYEFKYEKIGKNVSGLLSKSIMMFKNDYKLLKISNIFNPDLFVSLASPYSAHVSKLRGQPYIAFEDSEPARLISSLTIPFTTTVLTPISFRKDFGKKHIRLKGYKELAYLHPRWFRPNSDIWDMLDVPKNENYILIRFSAFDASHDLGINGFSLADKRDLVKELEKYARIFISSEIELPQDLKKYVIKIPPHKMHDALYYASLLVGDTGTMVTEAGILGTPAIISHPKSLKMSNFIELERKYGLIFNIHEPRMVIEKAVELLQQSDLNQEWEKRRANLLRDKIDVTAFMTWFIEQYPESFTEMKANPDYQEKFK
jgi:predicted glycosyltransferase